MLLLFGEYLAAGSTPGVIMPGTLKNAKCVEGLEVGDSKGEEAGAHEDTLMSRKGKTDYGAQNRTK